MGIVNRNKERPATNCAGESVNMKMTVSRIKKETPKPGHLSELPPVNEVNMKGQFFRASFGKNPRFQIQLDKWPVSPGTPREASGVPRPPGAARRRRSREAPLPRGDRLPPPLPAGDLPPPAARLPLPPHLLPVR